MNKSNQIKSDTLLKALVKYLEKWMKFFYAIGDRRRMWKTKDYSKSAQQHKETPSKQWNIAR
jgi:hypothetical protein